MNPVLGAVAAVVVAGAVVAVSARDGRLAVVGLAATLVFAPSSAARSTRRWALPPA